MSEIVIRPAELLVGSIGFRRFKMIVEMKNISKFFGKNQVLRDVDFTVKGGTVHALMGENGAGKSTLMNILIGLLDRSGGKIFIDGQEKHFADGKEAEEFGISFIHQEMNNWGEMTVLENMFLNKEIKSRIGLVKEKEMKAAALKYFDELGMKIDLNSTINELSVGQQQMVEIAKSLMNDCKILIMDEPTSALSETEITALFKIVRDLKTQGVGIVYISHRMEEIFSLCDEVTVMRDGVSIDTKPVSETDMDEIVRKMVGREIDDYYPEKHSEIGETIFKVEHMTSAEGKYQDISFEVRAGEIVGFSGLMGSGRTEMMRGIFGLDKNSSGEIYLEGNRITIKSPSSAIRQGIGFLTEDRKTEGLVLDFSLKDNISLPSLDGFIKHGLIDRKTENDFVDMLIKRLRIKSLSNMDTAGELSGGNQQKVVLAKWIGAGPKVLILDEPTRGVDVGAKREIYQLIDELAAHGVGIILVSSDLPEVLGVSDRIIVVHEGRIQAELDREEANQENVMTLATGGSL